MARWGKEAGVAVRESGNETAPERPEAMAGETPVAARPAAEAPRAESRSRWIGLGAAAAALGLVGTGAAVAAMLWRRRRAGPRGKAIRFGRRIGDAVRERIAGKG